MPARQGFGSQVIERITGQLKGKARFDWRPEGLVCEITLQA
jgi:two-component sensor histidine kinase